MGRPLLKKLLDPPLHIFSNETQATLHCLKASANLTRVHFTAGMQGNVWEQQNTNVRVSCLLCDPLIRPYATTGAEKLDVIR